MPAVVESGRSEVAVGSAWHALWTRSRHEPLVCSELTVKGIETFLPTFVRVSKWSDRTKRLAVPLFPGYCFARFTPQALSTVVRSTGVVSILSNGGTPIPIPTFEIEALQRTVASGIEMDPCSSLEPGAPVRVLRGPLTGVIGKLVRRGADNVLVLAVEILNSGARVQVSATDVEPI